MRNIVCYIGGFRGSWNGEFLFYFFRRAGSFRAFVEDSGNAGDVSKLRGDVGEYGVRFGYDLGFGGYVR